MKPSTVSSGTYVCANFNDETLDKLEEIQRSLRLLNPTPREKMHTTICYSRVYVPYMPFTGEELVSDINHLEVWDTKSGKTLVLVMQSEILRERHKYAEILGATYDFDEYKPHITLSYDIGVQLVELGGNLNIPIVSNSESVEILDLDYKI